MEEENMVMAKDLEVRIERLDTMERLIFMS